MGSSSLFSAILGKFTNAKQKDELSWRTLFAVSTIVGGFVYAIIYDDFFITQVSPQLAIISCGRKNRYGHPHLSTLQRLKQHDTSVLKTSQNGAISLLFINKKPITVKLGN